MDVSARSIHEKQFHDAWRGYSQEEVDDFLDRIAETVDRLQRENHSLTQRIRELDQAVSTSRDTEEMLKKTLVTAQRASEEAIASAKAKAEQLITEAEARVARANDEAKARMSALDDDVRRRTIDLDREHATRKRELEASIDRLRSFESELKQRLKGYLEQQTKALESLIDDRPAPTTRPEAAANASMTPGPATAQRPSGAPAVTRPTASGAVGPAQPSARPSASVPTQGQPPAEEQDESEDVGAPRRGLRGLFWGDES